MLDTGTEQLALFLIGACLVIAAFATFYCGAGAIFGWNPHRHKKILAALVLLFAVLGIGGISILVDSAAPPPPIAQH
jgi:hypothetical protein